MKKNTDKIGLALYCLLTAALFGVIHKYTKPSTSTMLTSKDGFTGSVSCRSCHEEFYELWSSSFHGLAMQPYTDKLAATLTPQTEPIIIGDGKYIAQTAPGQGWVLYTGPNGETMYPMLHTTGGKNVYYFLTPMAKGRLQVLPVAYDVNTNKWYDTAASAVRHFPGVEDTALDWTDPMYTFNTSCHSCHLSQLNTNYDESTDSYMTTWSEPGINCETCHGPGEAHIKYCLETPPDQIGEDTKLISNDDFTADQMNSMCSTCHAKAAPISLSFIPGETFFDHYNLTTLEHPDYYPDGRDLGENYTYTSWLMSPCVKNSDLDCMHCHTSSGRYRFHEPETANNACLPCHAERVANATEHIHHDPVKVSHRCIDCHMPMTSFGRMNRSDHSMRPPTPATTIKYESPNACNVCHTDKSAEWLDEQVRKWHKDDYQKPILEQAALIHAARNSDWSKLDDILEYIGMENRDEVIAASLLKMLSRSDNQKKWPVVIKALKEDQSPLVRTGAIQALGGYYTPESINTLAAATADRYRAVRIIAAATLALIDPSIMPSQYRESFKKATTEYMQSLNARPDDYGSKYNLGNFYMDRGEHTKSISSYEAAMRLRPDFVPPYVNAAFAYNAVGQNDKALSSFKKALEINPKSIETHLNLAMLYAEMKQIDNAAQQFHAALEIDPNNAPAAFNLGIIKAAADIQSAIKYTSKAFKLAPTNTRYGYTYAYYLNQAANYSTATAVLKKIIADGLADFGCYSLLTQIYINQNNTAKVQEICNKALKDNNLSGQEKQAFIQKLQQ